MKILYVTSAAGIDYQCDLLFHGLVGLGHDVVDSKYMWYMSKDANSEALSKMWGRGFTVGRTLGDRGHLDRSNIPDRISSKEFDLIIYGSIRRCSDFIDIVSQKYRRDEVCIVDGEDDTKIDLRYTDYGAYFKRELSEPWKAFPIQFGIPMEKFRKISTCKNRVMSRVMPRGASEKYIYSNEEEYYQDYSESLFGLTKKKGGWDCLRHYEIIAAGAIPYFWGFEKCPSSMMTRWPWSLQAEANYLQDRIRSLDQVSGRLGEHYWSLLEEFRSYAMQNLTTLSIAKHVLGIMGRS